MVAIINQTDDFVILGPTLNRDNKVLEAIHALYFLPDNFKMVFTGSAPADQSFLDEVASLVERNELGDRVSFIGEAKGSNTIVISDKKQAGGSHAVFGDSPEALASAILD